MANFDGYQPFEIARFSSLVEQDDPTNLPLGVSPFNRNIRFHLTGARTRDGIQSRYGFVLPDGGAVTGLAAQKIGQAGQADFQAPIAFSSLGNMYVESPSGSTRVQAISEANLPQLLPLSASMQAALAFKRAYLAFSDLRNSKGAPAVYNPLLGTLDPFIRPFGAPWTASTPVRVGDTVCPTAVGGNGHVYRCTTAGTTGVIEPNWQTGNASVTNDGTVVWTETTPVMAQAIPEPSGNGGPTSFVTVPASGGAFPNGRDVYLIMTFVNGQGETDGQTALAFKFVNTNVNANAFLVGNFPPNVLIILPNWVQNLAAPYAITGFNVYEADVATGNAAPALSAYKKVNGAPVAMNTDISVTTTGTGAAPPSTNTALIVPVGNICLGLRYLTVLFVNRNGAISGMSAQSVVSFNGGTNGLELYAANIATGPPETIARILCFTPAGQLNQLAGTGISNAGPYFYILPQLPIGVFDLTQAKAGITLADTVNGVQELSTVINDNVTTAGLFNFDDNYLKSTLNEVSAFFRKIQVPVCSDAYYSKTLRRMFFAADALPSGWYVSNQGAPEEIYGDTGIVQAAENNGENRTAVREWDSIVYLMKEKSGHVLTPSADDPSKWDVKEQWSGSGPCGPRAVDTCTTFMCYVHRSGVWIFKGGKPFRITKELPADVGTIWKSINWLYQHTISVTIDDETQQILIQVPTGQSTIPNLELVCNYEESPDFAPPIHFSPYVGKEIATGACYKWSVSDKAANLVIRAERTLLNAPAGFDSATTKSQLLYASANPDGAISAVVPLQFDDNGIGIDSVYETAAPQNLMRPCQIGGVQANIGGQGYGSVEVLALRAKDPKQGGAPIPTGKPEANAGFVRRLKKKWIAGIPYSCGTSGQNERFRLRFSNDKTPGCGFDLKWAAIYARPVAQARAG